jgi:hypothetical protein
MLRLLIRQIQGITGRRNVASALYGGRRPLLYRSIDSGQCLIDASRQVAQVLAGFA